MPRNYFTDEQMKILKQSPHVKQISRANVVFTEEFKTEFLKLYDAGIGPTEAIKRLGIDPKILGKLRIKKLAGRIREQSSRPEGFSRKPNGSRGRPRKIKHPEFDNDAQAAAYYKEYAERLEQEIELLKKIEALEEADRASRAKSSE
jgi:hypothetical protein